jgi:ABC-type transport system involved in cytochrome c biogenesis permease subunit
LDWPLTENEIDRSILCICDGMILFAANLIGLIKKLLSTTCSKFVLLMIHVAVIVGSYGPLALGMILGAVVLLLICLPMKKNKNGFEYSRNNLYQRIIINDRFDHADYW